MEREFNRPPKDPAERAQGLKEAIDATKRSMEKAKEDDISMYQRHLEGLEKELKETEGKILGKR